MASSPPEPCARQQLAEIAELWDRAAAALVGDDIEGALAAVDAAAPLLQSAPALAPTPAGDRVAERAHAAHAALQHRAREARDRVAYALRRAREGQRAMAGYRRRLGAAGLRVDRDG